MATNQRIMVQEADPRISGVRVLVEFGCFAVWPGPCGILACFLCCCFLAFCAVRLEAVDLLVFSRHFRGYDDDMRGSAGVPERHMFTRVYTEASVLFSCEGPSGGLAMAFNQLHFVTPTSLTNCMSSFFANWPKYVIAT